MQNRLTTRSYFAKRIRYAMIEHIIAIAIIAVLVILFEEWLRRKQK